jgi:hypothetical protein
MREKIIRNCPECGELILGRTDKKFCSDLCRNSYNNINQSDTNRKLSLTNRILKKNRQILEELIEQSGGKVTEEKLCQRGFNFYFITGYYYHKKNIYFYCYEYGYCPLKNGFYGLVKQKIEQ